MPSGGIVRRSRSVEASLKSVVTNMRRDDPSPADLLWECSAASGPVCAESQRRLRSELGFASSVPQNDRQTRVFRA